MEGKITAKHKELADKLRGRMSYGEHYAYLLDWYMNDRCGWETRQQNKALNMLRQHAGAGAVEDHVKESFKDVLDALKHLERRVDRVSAHVHNHSKPNGHKADAGDAGKAEAAKPVRHNFRPVFRIARPKPGTGNVFTRLVDKKRTERREFGE